jgi:hypothetical protein
MSKVYSFRFSEDNPREVQARIIIEAREQKGYSLRQIIVEALLNSYEDEKGINNILEQIMQSISNMECSLSGGEPSKQDMRALSTSFLCAMKGSVKTGLQTE